MMLTKYAIEKMGFTEHPESDELEISFGIIKAYSLRDLVFEKDSKLKQSQVPSFGTNCTSVIGQSINEACKLLTEDDFTDDEEKWLSDNKVSPPFLLIYFWESESRMLRGGYRQEKDGSIVTYDAFPEVMVEIQNWEHEVELRIITALTVHLSTLERQVEIVPVARHIFGTTHQGGKVYDIKVTGSATLSVSSPKSAEAMNQSLAEAVKLFGDLTKDSSRHFYAALNEIDRLKKFLGYFLFIERLTHRTFKSLSYEGNAKQLFHSQQRLEKSAEGFFSTIFSESKTLTQRFHWCAMLAWNQIDDQVIKHFIGMKKVRDRLAHGEHIDESDLPVEKAKTLGLKLLGAKEN
ncbi:hypothetical protein [Chromohalobacter sp. HP20-39]|uniref:hypothetical protein n=1 Tax=Chromohalobacter sp. HP20-39 TaxID=3079306 RepID=UPI00294AD9F5|nr:hypothetical protein [Chromohalobacter sp. HP20-39]MDV6318707.1 hypothetical protein [Chromohalobacter sp. HP20-39]